VKTGGDCRLAHQMKAVPKKCCRISTFGRPFMIIIAEGGRYRRRIS
jgi:hypothetical protein